MPIEELARAKVNLALHVTGRRADGYHALDSLVVFAGIGDRLTAAPARDLTLRIDGPQAAGLSAADNLVMRAALLLSAGRGADLHLEKVLPVASGIGGGSADAAAALRLLSRLWGVPLPPAQKVLALGADVPVCLQGRAVRMQGVGEVLTPLPPLPAAWLVLVNPGKALPTPAVFAALDRRENPALPPIPPLPDARALATWLATCRNDLEAPAESLCPDIGRVRAALADQPGCLIARMSGSGATCFGLFADYDAAANAVAALGRDHPGWWTAEAPLQG
ncbi:MAG: 4-(cytidine 5'-diphospho)-2-C-methyl-D-erythritol kinase [Paracoccaceae bacterium]